MNTKTAKLISPERVVQLLDCYGADPEAWPDDERRAALALIHHSEELRQLQKEAGQLDQFLVSGIDRSRSQVTENSRLITNILSNLPEQEVPPQGKSRVRKPYFGSGNWLGMIAASIAVFVISVSIMELQPASGPHQQNSVAQQELEMWMWQQVSGDSESDDEEPMTMMSLLELEEL